jgi:hypothetical protein
MQPDTDAADRAAVDRAIDDLARWLRVDEVRRPKG